MSRVIFLLLLVFAVEVHAQETLPGDTCTTAGIFRQSGGPEIATGGHFLVCDGANWKSILDFKRTGELSSIGNQVCASGEILVFDGTKWACGTAGGGGSGSFQFNDTGQTCNSTNEGVLLYDSVGFLKICDGLGWTSLFAKDPCALWQDNKNHNCSSFGSGVGNSASRAACQADCEASDSFVCQWNKTTSTCRKFTLCSPWGTVTNTNYDIVKCF